MALGHQGAVEEASTIRCVVRPESLCTYAVLRLQSGTGCFSTLFLLRRLQGRTRRAMCNRLHRLTRLEHSARTLHCSFVLGQPTLCFGSYLQKKLSYKVLASKRFRPYRNICGDSFILMLHRRLYPRKKYWRCLAMVRFAGEQSKGLSNLRSVSRAKSIRKAEAAYSILA